MIDLYIARHGQTEENVKGMLQGHLPGHLTSLGKQQAEDLADKLENIEFDVIICSDLQRAKDTAIAVAKRKSMMLIETELLREMDWGVYTGGEYKKINWTDLPKGVETLENMFDRAHAFFRFLHDNYEDKKVLVVAHGAFNRAMKSFYAGDKPIDQIRYPIMDNGDILRMILMY
ncbi:MAG: histidine phosphatase family protein [Bacteroidales bacterium]